MTISLSAPSILLRAAARLGCRLRSAATLLAAAAATSLISPAAQAHDRDVVAKVVPLQPSAVYSRAATTTRPAQTLYAGYTVTVKNVDDDPLTDVHFIGTTSVTETTEQAVFAFAQGATCVPDTAGTTVDCAVGPLAKWQSVTFTLYFKTPVNSTALPPGDLANCTATDCIGFAGTVRYVEDEGYRYAPKVESEPWTAPSIALALPDPNKVSSAVPGDAALSLYTGDAAIPLGLAVPFATQIDVPAGYTPPVGSLPVASIVQTADQLNCVSFYNCFRSEVTLPGTIAPYLTVVLRVDAANVKPGVRIGGVLITYDGQPVGDCASPTTPLANGFPCIAARKVYPVPCRYKYKHRHRRDSDDMERAEDLRSRPPYATAPTTDLEGDFEWTLINTHNGSFKIF